MGAERGRVAELKPENGLRQADEWNRWGRTSASGRC